MHVIKKLFSFVIMLIIKKLIKIFFPKNCN